MVKRLNCFFVILAMVTLLLPFSVIAGEGTDTMPAEVEITTSTELLSTMGEPDGENSTENLEGQSQESDNADNADNADTANLVSESSDLTKNSQQDQPEQQDGGLDQNLLNNSLEDDDLQDDDAQILNNQDTNTGSESSDPINNTQQSQPEQQVGGLDQNLLNNSLEDDDLQKDDTQSSNEHQPMESGDRSLQQLRDQPEIQNSDITTSSVNDSEPVNVTDSDIYVPDTNQKGSDNSPAQKENQEELVQNNEEEVFDDHDMNKTNSVDNQNVDKTISPASLRSAPVLLGEGSDGSPQYTIEFIRNSGTGTMDPVQVPAGEYKLPECGYKRNGYEFAGWLIPDFGIMQPGTPITVDTDMKLTAQWTWAGGSVYVGFGIVNTDAVRNTWQDPYAGNTSWAITSWWLNGSAKLLNDKNEVVAEISGVKEHTFKNLPAGKYKIQLPAVTSRRYVAIKGVTDVDETELITGEYSAEFIISETNPKVTKKVIVEKTAYAFELVTQVGQFSNGKKNYQYYKGGNWAVKSSGDTWLNTHNGIYYDENASQYITGELQQPVLNDEEKAAGYSFVGWKLIGDDTGKIYSSHDALSYKVKNDTKFEAVWEYPTHTVTFATNTAYGLINGESKFVTEYEYDNQKINEIPAVTPKDGYEFIGWFTDLTTNVIPESEIKETEVNKDLYYYAKYRRIKSDEKTYNVTYTQGTNGTLSGTSQLMLKEGSFIPTIPTVNPNEGYSFTGKWKVTAVSEGCDVLKAGDELNEIQISRLQINYDVNFEAQYEAVEKPTEAPTEPSTEEPTEKPTEPSTEEPTEKPTEQPTREPERPTWHPAEWPTKFVPEYQPQVKPWPVTEPTSPVEPETKTPEPETTTAAEPESTQPETKVTPVNPVHPGGGSSGSSGRTSSVPKTGDESNALLWGLLGGISIIAIAAILILGRKRIFSGKK